MAPSVAEKEIVIYGFQPAGLERSVARLLEKVYEQGSRAVVKFDDAEDLEHYNTMLWTFTPLSFLPHGKDTGLKPEAQPILLTADAATVQSPANGAEVGVAFTPQDLEALMTNKTLKKCLLLADTDQLNHMNVASLACLKKASKAMQHIQSADGTWATISLT